MNQGIISRRYATALWIHSTGHGAQEQVYRDTQLLAKAYLGHDSLRRVLSNRVVGAKEKIEVIKAICGADISREFEDFVALVFTSHREDFLQTMCLSYGTIYLKENKILEVEITSARPMDKAMQGVFAALLGEKTGQNIELNCQVDPAIMGGYVLRWDTYRLDASVHTKLKSIKNALMAGV